MTLKKNELLNTLLNNIKKTSKDYRNIKTLILIDWLFKRSYFENINI